MSGYTLGQRVRYSSHLQRVYKFEKDDRYGRKEWAPVTTYKGEPIGGEGIIIGKRTLSNGLNQYNGYDEPIVFIPKERFAAYIIAFDLQRKPVHVLPEHITLLEES